MAKGTGSNVKVKDKVTAQLISKADNKPRVESGLISPEDQLTAIGKLFRKYKADKCPEHSDLYEMLFRSLRYQEINLLEIGIARGGSLHAWRDYFPKASIWGLDIKNMFPENSNVKIVPDVEYLCGDQGDEEFMKKLAGIWDKKPLDIVIDDGGHKSHQQQTSWKYLWPKMRHGGLYIIEDLHVANRRGFLTHGWDSTLNWLKTLPVKKAFYFCQRFDRDICVMAKGKD